MTKLQTGLKPSKRKLATTVRPQAKRGKLTANQWQNTPQQNKFMANWISPASQTFGNAYTSALEAGYSPHYANRIAAQSMNNKWIEEYRRKLEFGPEHVKQLLQSLAITANNSRSPDDTRVKSLEVLTRVFGMVNDKSSVTVNVVQPILGGESIKHKDIIDQ